MDRLIYVNHKALYCIVMQNEERVRKNTGNIMETDTFQQISSV